MLNTYKHLIFLLPFLSLGLISCSKEKPTSNWQLTPPMIQKQNDLQKNSLINPISSHISKLNSGDKVLFSNIDGAHIKLKTQCSAGAITYVDTLILPALNSYTITQLLPKSTLKQLLVDNTASCSFNFIIGKNEISHRFSMGPFQITYDKSKYNIVTLFEKNHLLPEFIPEINHSTFNKIEFLTQSSKGKNILLCQKSELVQPHIYSSSLSLSDFSEASNQPIQLTAPKQTCIVTNYNGQFLESYSSPIKIDFGFPDLLSTSSKYLEITDTEVRSRSIGLPAVILTNKFNTKLVFRVTKTNPVEYSAEFNHLIYSKIKTGHLEIKISQQYLVTETSDYFYYEVPPHDAVEINLLLITDQICFLNSAIGSYRSTPKAYGVTEFRGGIEILNTNYESIGVFLKPTELNFPTTERHNNGENAQECRI